MKRTPETIQETRDVLDFIDAAYARWQKVNADGKVTLFEWPQFLGEVAEAKAAFKGIGSIPRELNDLDESEAEEIIAAIGKIFGSEVPTEKRVVVDKMLVALHSFLDAVAEMRGVNPPRPTVVE